MQHAGVGRLPDNTALVIFGSFARDEITRSSDLDWTFLVDGRADPQHFKIASEIGHTCKQAGFAAPGTTMTFGTMASSHELIHHIGLDEDTNRNFTRRMLLLLESRSVAGEVIHHRVIRGILDRYLVAERSVAWNPDERQVPRFLLNDIVRFWRTMAVDYAAKKWQQDNKWALRNAKLRMSRKLLYASGLLICFNCELEPPAPGPQQQSIFPDEPDPDMTLLNYVFEQSRMTPLNILANAIVNNEADGETAGRILSSYDRFIEILNDTEYREHLANLPLDRAKTDSRFGEIREIGHRFQDGLDRLFLKSNDRLRDLTLKYGIF